MNYSEKLKDRRWLAFRQEFIYSRRRREGGDQCDDCGEDTAGPLHVHHKRYIKGREPWEYDYADLRLICETCHDIIHGTEDFVREWIRTLPPYACHEFQYLMHEIMDAHKISVHAMQIACAHAKNAARDVAEGYLKQPAAGASSVRTMAELAADYRESLNGVPN